MEVKQWKNKGKGNFFLLFYLNMHKVYFCSVKPSKYTAGLQNNNFSFYILWTIPKSKIKNAYEKIPQKAL